MARRRDSGGQAAWEVGMVPVGAVGVHMNPSLDCCSGALEIEFIAARNGGIIRSVGTDRMSGGTIGGVRRMDEGTLDGPICSNQDSAILVFTQNPQGAAIECPAGNDWSLPRLLLKGPTSCFRP